MEVAVQTTAIATQRNQDDYNIVRRAIKGDQKAYALLMERYRNSVYHTMLKMVNNRDDADDLTIEAFGKAFAKLSSYVPRYAFSTWLFRIAINNAIDYIRKRKLHIYSIDESVDGEGSSDYSFCLKSSCLDPEEEIIRTQRIQLMRQLLGQLNNKYRLMIELRYFEELSYEEIADELGIPLGTVKAQLFRAKEMLANMLEQPGASAYLELASRRA
jgi:RNA polymerase sigma-70 factor (ECF subfamily)